jgi:hypothetical protein
MHRILIFLALVFCTSSALGSETKTISGKVLTGEIKKLTDKELVLAGPSGETTTPIGQVLSIDRQIESNLPSGKLVDVELIDGSLLHCGRVFLRGKEAELELGSSGQKIKVPLASLSYVLNDADDAATRDEWAKLLAKRRNQDIVAIKREGVINGLEGTLGEVNEKGEIGFEYQLGGGRRKRDLDPARIQGMIFQRAADSDTPAPLCRISDSNQNLWVAAKINMAGTNFTVTLASRTTIDLPLASVKHLDFANDKIVFLSDLKPAEVVEKSRQGRKDGIHIDRNLDNGQIKIEGQPYPKGLALHSHTELTYALEGKYRKLEAILGMDDAVGGHGQPVVRIEGDGKELFAATINRSSKSQKLDLDVKGIKQLRVVVTSNGLFDFGDHVDLANAKLSK